MKKVLFFCDPGIDDSIAIMYALLHPEIELVGIVTSYGNVTKDQATKNAAYLLQLAGASHIPIIPGASMPIQQKNVTYYPLIHGKDGIGPVCPPSDIDIQIYPFDAIRQLISYYKGDVIIVDTGRSTTLANTFILYPDELKQVGAFYVMGGAFFVPGNVTPLAEANFFGDPTSANFILKHARPLTIAPLNVTNYAYFTTKIVEQISSHTSNPYRFMIKPIFDYYYKAYQSMVPGIVGAPIHDLVPMMMVVNPSIASYLHHDAKVIEDGLAKGQSYMDLRPGSKQGKTEVAIQLHYDAFILDVLRVMGGHF